MRSKLYRFRYHARYRCITTRSRKRMKKSWIEWSMDLLYWIGWSIDLLYRIGWSIDHPNQDVFHSLKSTECCFATVEWCYVTL